MGARALIRVGIALDILLLLPALYMAESAAEIAARVSGSIAAVGVAVLFAALPVFCIVAPFAANRALKRNRRRTRSHLVGILAAPWIYALFLVVFLFSA